VTMPGGQLHLVRRFGLRPGGGRQACWSDLVSPARFHSLVMAACAVRRRRLIV